RADQDPGGQGDRRRVDRAGRGAEQAQRDVGPGLTDRLGRRRPDPGGHQRVHGAVGCAAGDHRVGDLRRRRLPRHHRMSDPAGGSGYDALLLLSFGGPEGPADVRPFLENVTRGRGVPPERLDEVAEHYLHFGGVSPINALNTAMIDRIEAELAARGIDLPVYFGNRNWHPMVEDTVAAMARDGVRRALVLATSAWAGFSGCGQYQDDIARARAAAGRDAPELVRLRQFHDHPLLIAAFADAVRAARTELGDDHARVRLVFTAHSIPVAADAAAGPPQTGGRLYSRQVRETAALVA